MVLCTRGNPEESEESHPECSEVSVFSQALAGILLLAAQTAKHLHSEGGEYEEQQEEEQAEVPDLKQPEYRSFVGSKLDLG